MAFLWKLHREKGCTLDEREKKADPLLREGICFLALSLVT